MLSRIKYLIKYTTMISNLHLSALKVFITWKALHLINLSSTLCLLIEIEKGQIFPKIFHEDARFLYLPFFTVHRLNKIG
jgi:hypothetical protein